MLEYRRRVIESALRGLFLTDRDQEAVMDWWIANDGRRPVILVGAGYSRNALEKGTTKRATWLATWNEVGARLCKDLRIDANQFDAPTVADLYCTRFGPGRLHDVLLSLVPDDRLEAGDAHDALLNYDAEAIVTTNHLDTLLDRQTSHWDRVVSDHDVAKLDPTRERTRQIIYYHGHRHDLESWVVRRTEFEDHELKRPVLGARVRQLLAQHPLLAVGYSLTDPDFHAIYRRMSRHMGRRQPLGLALLVSAPDAASEEYWRDLGIVVATLKPGDYSARFCSFFASAKPRVSTSQLLEIFSDNDTVKNRLRILGEYIDDQEREKFVDSSADRDEQLLWDALRNRLPEAERDGARRRKRLWTVADSTSVESGPSVTSKGTEKRETLEHFPADRFSGHSDRIWILNRLVHVDHGWAGIAEWARIVFQRPPLRQAAEQTFRDFSSLVSWTWTQAAKADPKLRDEALRVMSQCLLFAGDYDLTTSAKWIREDLAALGAKEADPAAAIPANPAQGEMELALRLALDAQWVECESAYKRAGEAANEARDHFGAWLAAEGRAWAAWRGSVRRKDDDPLARRRIDALEREAKALSEQRDVAWWREKSKQRLEALRKRTIEEQRQELRDGDRDVERFSFSTAPPYDWRSWRDLETRAAPPLLQGTYLEPLLAAGRLNDLGKELRARIRLEVEKTKEWIDDVCSSPERDGAAQSQLMDALREASEGTRTERTQVVELLPVVMQIVRQDDLPWITAFLDRTQTEFSNDTETLRGSRVSARDHARARVAVAGVLPGRVALETVAKTFSGESATQQSELASLLGDLHWQAWISTGLDVDEAISTCLSPTLKRLDSSAALGVTVAISDILRIARDWAKPVSSQTAAASEQWLRRVVPMKVDNWIRPHVLHAATELFLGLMTSPSDELALVSELIAAAEAATSDEGLPAAALSPSLEARCRVLGALLSHRPSPLVDEAADRLVRDLESEWVKICNHLALNPRRSGPVAHILVESLLNLRAGANADWIRASILELAELSPSVLPILAPVMSSTFWPGMRPRLDRLLRVGGWHRGRSTRLMFRVDLLARLVSDRLRRGAALPDTCQHLPDLAILGTEERDDTVANHAAYALVAWLELAEDEALANAAVDTIERIADDPRVSVRHAAAYGSARLARAARLADVRRRMEAVGVILAGDASAQVQRQIDVGRAEGERRSGPNGDATES